MKLSTFLRDEQAAILQACECPTLHEHLPQFVIELAGALEDEPSWFDEEAERQGESAFKRGIAFSELASEYDRFRRTVHRLYRERGGEEPSDTFDSAIDRAIADARNAYATPLVRAVRRGGHRPGMSTLRS